jgi:hypothetical protein
MSRVLPWTAVAALLVVPAVWAAAWAADRWMSMDVTLITPHDPDVVAFERDMFSEGDPVPELYGIPMEQSARVFRPDPSRLVFPTEDPGLVLMRVDKQAGENPLQVKTIWFLVRWATVGLVGLAAGLMAIAGFVRWRQRPTRG